MGRILAIDYGLKRVGLAVTDTGRIIASPLDTCPTGKLMDYLKAYCQKEPVDAFVLGIPTQANGSFSEIMPHIQGFRKRLLQAFPEKPVHDYNERYTSVIALQAISSSGAGKKLKADKGLADRTAATILLQDWLEFNRISQLRNL